MTTPRKTLFISDIHLDANTPHINQQFIEFLSQLDSHVDALYILGDLFETWIGDDDDAPLHRQIMLELAKVTAKGIPVYFMRGNRDFLVRQRFMRATGCQLLPDEKKLMLYGEPVLLMHGDTLCTDDHAYQKARKIAYNPLLQKVFLCLPLKLRRKIANRLRAKSAAHTQQAPKEIMDVTLTTVSQVLKKHDVRYLIHGHTHRPAVHLHYLDDGSKAERIVLGAWHDTGNALTWNETGHHELIQLGGIE